MEPLMSISFNVSAPKMPETQGHLCQGNHKKRLIVGDGNFSFTEALINKHDKKAHHTSKYSLAHSIIATDYKDQSDCDDCELEWFGEFWSWALCDGCKRIQKLLNSGVTVLLGVDGTRLHHNKYLKPFKFSRIHWNCPHDGSSMKEQTLPKLIGSFFMSCAKIQKASHRVHVTLAQPGEKNHFYQGYYYNIVGAASIAGYALIKKRLFDSNRYPGYHHVQTNSNTSAPVTEEGMREFVFEKLDKKSFHNALEGCINNKSIDLTGLACSLQNYSKKTYMIGISEYYREWRDYYECSTDDDSSDCESKD